MVSKLRNPSSSMWVIMTPISSMWPASITRGDPPSSRVAKEFPATSACTDWANFAASARHTLPGAASNEDGPGVSNSSFRKVIDSGVIGPVQLQLEKYRSLYRMGVVGGDRLKTQPPVESNSRVHAWETVQPHPLISSDPGFVHDSLSEHSAESAGSVARTNIESLHLTGTWRAGPERHTAGNITGVMGQQQAALRRRIHTWQARELLVKALKA